MTISIYTTLVITPLSLYFIYFSGGLTSEHVTPLLILLVPVTLMREGLEWLWRTKYFNRFQNLWQEIQTSSSQEAQKQLKIGLLSYPMKESIIQIGVVFIVVTLFYLAYSLMVTLPVAFLPTFAIVLIPLMLILLLLVYLIAERIIGPILALPQLSNVPVKRAEISGVLNEKKRKILLIVAATSIPIAMLGSFFVEASAYGFSFSHQYLHVIAVIFLTISMTAIMVYESERSSVSLMLKVIKDLEQGNISSESIPMTSNSEVGFLMQDINSFHSRMYNIINNILQATQSVSGGSEQISRSASEISSTASNQAANVEETSASLEEITSMINETSTRAQQTLTVAQETERYSQEGKQVLEQVIHEIRLVSEKTGLVEEIAQQTNLLALNASIEAARAGEYGRGFSVVAAEVGKLAEGSSNSAQEITELAKSTLEASEKAGRFFEIILPRINESTQLFEQIMRSSQEEKSGINQINSSMSQLNQIAQNNAASSEELSALAEQMKMYAKELEEEIKFFQLK